MSTQDDRLREHLNPNSSSERGERTYYATGVLLDAEDFQAEQLYHRSRLARTLAYLHGHGTVAGLRVRAEEALAPGEDIEYPDGREEQIRVLPGLAVDRLGRLIELPRSACIRLDRWVQAQSNDGLTQAFHGPPYNGIIADIFLRFVVCEQGLTPAFATGPFDALDAVAPSRLQDSYELEMFLRPNLDGSPPTPEDLWEDVNPRARVANRRRALQNAMLDGWREGSSGWDKDGPTPLREHLPGQDTTSVLLARVVIPAEDGSPPTRLPEAAVEIDNHLRPFVYASSAVTRWLGIEIE